MQTQFYYNTKGAKFEAVEISHDSVLWTGKVNGTKHFCIEVFVGMMLVWAPRENLGDKPNKFILLTKDQFMKEYSLYPAPQKANPKPNYTQTTTPNIPFQPVPNEVLARWERSGYKGLVHVEGWKVGGQFLYKGTTDGEHTLETPKTRKIYKTTNRLLYVRNNTPEKS